MSKSRWSIRYLLLKLGEACDATQGKFQALNANAGNVSDKAARKAMDSLSDEFAKTFYQRVTEVIKMVGPAMTPTLNRKASEDPSDSELLILRRLRGPSDANVRVGDIVAFPHPAGYSEDSLMVRRVVCGPGDILADDKEELVLEPGQCWVTADNKELEPPHVEDSRSFGPLPLESIEGRIIYAIRSLTDHAPLDNSLRSKADDAPIVDVEVADILSDPELFEPPPKESTTTTTDVPKGDDAAM